MEFHPFADPWPLMQGQPFDDLVADIKAHGLRQAIITYQQKILDGRNRYNACVKAGVPPRYEPAKVKSDYEALMLSASLNKHRRHMSAADLAFVAAELATLQYGQNKRYIDTALADTRADKNKPVVTAEEAAKAVGVGVSSVHDAKTLNAPEHADIKKRVLDKKIGLRSGADVARLRNKAKKGLPKKTAAEVLAINAAKTANHKPRNLTRQDVDPEFVGDELAFVAEYGHVWMKTSQERSTDHLTAWAIATRHLARTLRDQKLPKISPVVLSWLRKPKPADVESLRASLAELELAVATARDLLDRAQSAMAERQNGQVPKSHGGREVGA